ncbi:MAG TPA: FtsX-like permease family protein [Alphaproteobacteria bacterium]
MSSRRIMDIARLRRRPRPRPWGRTDLALATGEGRTYLPWVIGIMSFLAALALAAALAVSSTANRWTLGLTGTWTVEIAADTAGGDGDAMDRLATVLDILRNTPGVVQAEPVDREQLTRMIEPWLGPGASAPDLPLPQLVDVRLAPDARIDRAALVQRLAAVPGVTIDDHHGWVQGLVRLAHLAVLFALVVVVLVGLAASGTVVFATRAGLAAHQDAIEILHLMGAHDSHVARQFARMVLRRSAIGAVLGVIAAVATFYGLAWAARTIAPSILPTLRLGALDWVAIAALPLAASAVAALTAWQTVMRTLRKML